MQDKKIDHVIHMVVDVDVDFALCVVTTYKAHLVYCIAYCVVFGRGQMVAVSLLSIGTEISFPFLPNGFAGSKQQPTLCGFSTAAAVVVAAVVGW